MYERIQSPIYQTKNPNEDIQFTKDENIANFMQKTTNTFNFFYKRAATLDRLNGLTDPEIINLVNQAPSYIKRIRRRLLKRLERYNVKVKPNGNVDFSKCSNKQFKDKYKDDPVVKLILLEKEIDFGHKHHKDYTQEITELERKIEELQAKENFEERDLKELSDILVSENPKLDKEILERTTNFSVDSISKLDSESMYQESLARKARAEKKETTESLIETIKSVFSQYIVDESVSNKLIETYTERIRRIEAIWLKHRIAKLSQEENDKASIYQMLQQLKLVANDLRRLKFLLDQKALIDAKQLYFEEHSVFNKEEMMIDRNIHYELLFDYFNIPESERVQDDNQKYFDNKIVDIIKQDPLKYDIVKPFKEFERLEFKLKPTHMETTEEDFDLDPPDENEQIRSNYGINNENIPTTSEKSDDMEKDSESTEDDIIKTLKENDDEDDENSGTKVGEEEEEGEDEDEDEDEDGNEEKDSEDEDSSEESE